MTMDIAEFVATHAGLWRAPVFEPKVFGQMKYVTPIRPSEYLEFANTDLGQGTLHGLVNALSNAKRAIDCQVTCILQGLGLSKAGNFPTKVAQLQKLSLLAPRIVTKVVRVRNLLEHEFQKPTQTEAEDAIDVATLFIEASRRVFQSRVESFYVADEASASKWPSKKIRGRTIIDEKSLPEWTFANAIYVELDEERRDFGLWGVVSNKEVLQSEVLTSDPLHFVIVAFLVRNYMDREDFNREKAGQEFLELLTTVGNSVPTRQPSMRRCRDWITGR